VFIISNNIPHRAVSYIYNLSSYKIMHLASVPDITLMAIILNCPTQQWLESTVTI
jgi:hypothetical protein